MKTQWYVQAFDYKIHVLQYVFVSPQNSIDSCPNSFSEEPTWTRHSSHPRTISSDRSVKCKINSWNEWNAIWISMVNCFFINLHDLLLFVNLSILFMKIQPIWYFVWPPIWQSSDICIVQFQYLSTNSYFINCVELSWWQIPGMIHVTYIVCHGIDLYLVLYVLSQYDIHHMIQSLNTYPF